LSKKVETAYPKHDEGQRDRVRLTYGHEHRQQGNLALFFGILFVQKDHRILNLLAAKPWIVNNYLFFTRNFLNF